jgi:hypothetical protein
VPEVRAAAPGEVTDVEVDGEAQLIYYGLWGRLPLKSVGDEAVLRALRVDR